MAEGSDKTEAPTPRRRAEARRQGQVGRSADLSAAVTVLVVLIVLNKMGKGILGRLLEVTRNCLSRPMSPDDLGTTLAYVWHELAAIVLPILVAVFVGALVIAFSQVGFILTPKPLTPSFDKLNPVNGLKRMFGGRSVMHFTLGVVKTVVLSAVAYITLKNRIADVMGACTLDHLSIIAAASELVFTLGIRLAIVLVVLGIIDFIYQRWKVERDLRMTKEEVKEELRRMDGDPHIKRRRREVQLQMALQRLRAAVPKADVVITNPTELAIVVQYDADRMTAPRVTGKGADYLAKRIRELAVEHGVPIVERKPLAQALYKTVEVGQEIPAQFYKAVAEILAYVYELAGKSYERPARAAAAAALN